MMSVEYGDPRSRKCKTRANTVCRVFGGENKVNAEVMSCSRFRYRHQSFRVRPLCREKITQSRSCQCPRASLQLPISGREMHQTVLARQISTDPMNRMNPRNKFSVWLGARNNRANCLFGTLERLLRSREVRRLEQKDR